MSNQRTNKRRSADIAATPGSSKIFAAANSCRRTVIPVASTSTKDPESAEESRSPSPNENYKHFEDNESQYFQTQFIRKIDQVAHLASRKRPSLATPAKKLPHCFGFSQDFTPSPREDTEQNSVEIQLSGRIANKTEDHNANVSDDLTTVFSQSQNECTIIGRPHDVSDIDVASFFDDEDDDLFNQVKDSDYQSSQVFLNDVKSFIAEVNPGGNSDGGNVTITGSQYNQMLADDFTFYQSNKTMNEYLELQRTMHAENQYNVQDDELDGRQLETVTQYRMGIETTFNECERTIRGLDEDMFKDLTDEDEETVQTTGNKEAAHNFTEFETDFDLSVLENALRTEENRGIDTSEVKPEPFLTQANQRTVKRESQTAVGHNFTETDFDISTLDKVIEKKCRDAKEILKSPLIPKSKKIVTNVVKPVPVPASTFCVMGPFFGLPNKVKSLIREYKGINDLYDWQKECLQLPAIEHKRNLIYALPTSGGKTLVSEIIILREILCRRRNCLFILPYVSIVQEKVWALSPFAVQLDFLIEEYAAGKGILPPRKRRKKKSVYIATIEKGLALMDSLIEAGRANEIGLVVVDELHIIGEGGRGAVLESLLTKVQYIKAGIQIVGMSATIGNLDELAMFLNADVYNKDFRPVELREHIKCASDILEIRKDAIDIESTFVPVRTVDFKYNEEVLRMDPDHITGLITEIIPDSSCLVFCPTKKNCENLSMLVCHILSRKYLDHKTAEKQNLIKAIEDDTGSKICPILAKTLPYGIAYHHSGLTVDERRHLEDAFRTNVICVICCTSTLAAGVNLPAKRVIIRSPYVGREFITLSRYKQMVGRAGRAGFGESGDSILICAARDNMRVMSLLCSPMDEVVSHMHDENARALRTLLLSSIGLNMASCRTDIKRLAASTLTAVQAHRLEIDMVTLTDETIKSLIMVKAISAKSTQNPDNSLKGSDIELVSQDGSFVRSSPVEAGGTQAASNAPKKKVQNVIKLKPSTPLEISRLGKASFKSGISLERAHVVMTDLMQAQRSLVLVDFLHLLYLVTPYEPSDVQINPDKRIYYSKYSNLTPLQLHTASVIGITESVAIKLISGKTFKPELERTVNKFFLTLILNDLWQMKTATEIALSFQVDRGLVQNLMGSAAIYASSILKFCEEMDELWCYKDLLTNLAQRLSYCCTIELLPLMQLPCVKLARAKQLFNSGFKKLEDIASATARDLTSCIEHLNERTAKQLISAAKVLLIEKVETLREEAQDCMDVLVKRN